MRAAPRHRHAKRAIAIGAVAWTCLLGACHNDLGALFAKSDAGAVDAGAVRDAGDAGSGPPAPGDILAMYSDLGEGDACVQCLRRECSEVERSCAEDPQCTEAARCAAKCRNPNCMLQCPRAGVDAYLSLGPETPHACRARACVDECGVGRNFDCVEHFEWERPTLMKTPTIIVTTQILSSVIPEPSEVSIRYCDFSLNGCDGKPASTLEPSALESPLDTILGQKTLGPMSLDPQSYFEVMAQGFEPHLVYPLFDRAGTAPAMLLSIIDPQAYATGFGNFVLDDDAAYGFLVIFPFDCLVDPAPGIRFELSPTPTHPDFVEWYGYPPDPALKQTKADFVAVGGFGLVDQGPLTVWATQVDSGKVVARAAAISRAGARTVIFLAPRSRSDPPR